MLKRSKIGSIASRVKGNALHLEQIFPASPDLVYNAFTDKDILSQWWGPNGWGLTFCEVDLQPGGAWHFCMTCQDESKDYFGQQSWGKAIYVEIDAPNKLVYRDCFSDAEGNIDPNMPETLVTLTFEQQAKYTKVRSTAEFPTKEDLDQVMQMGLVVGITETWSKLDRYLKR
ncbi:SRPBCC family protein [Paenibacillus endoradicis]|uniref:SRPBCC family protein n=1 Tax=Paenibacillus endoradicis TaxID=2972487 RepID=UPI002159774A|nr:SRPBCC domain-containing protein [Paenibacillus endoradicis]MCR8657130.1 SRPBCC domain-containing protein [Paenibacillus endoradicis]